MQILDEETDRDDHPGPRFVHEAGLGELTHACVD